MFVTSPDYTIPLISTPGTAGEQAYRAFQVIGRTPWFLVRLSPRYAGASIRHTICCALDVDLLDLLQDSQAHSIAGIQMLSPMSPDESPWQLRNAVRIWRSVDQFGNRLLTFEDEHGREFGYDTVHKESRNEAARELVFCRK